ncbi:AraC family transcriptional regulator [Pseudoalteromonas phenolica]|uniref:AraC family transcriptional regulator n=1 Tax=Pseudoalteromonas phenolica TaxID=161398 RepID=A0A4V2EJV5_9GAMM|nr:AraC family transcriptional regulator [Pseudoalteromonas phenolica]RZQ53668.1 AraC family transcriptional regulator [Pseudoalteromonas phenolica]
MQSLITQLELLAPSEGYNQTFINGVGIYKSSESAQKTPLCYSQGIIFVLQGQKRVFFDEQIYTYNPDNYLVLTVPLPAECETQLINNKPLLSLIIDFDVPLLGELVRVFDEHGKLNSSDKINNAKGLFVSENTDALSCTLTRLVDCLSSKLQSDVIGKGLIREVFYYVLQGPQASPLFDLVSHNTHMSKMERILKHLHNHYDDRLDVEQLASMANMSPSTFHRNFKQITASSPIQYVKKLRLSKAKDLLQDQGLKVKQAAAQVGYESATQFSREFTRYFGLSPSDYAKAN